MGLRGSCARQRVANDYLSPFCLYEISGILNPELRRTLLTNYGYPPVVPTRKGACVLSDLPGAAWAVDKEQ